MKITGIIAEYNPFHNGHAYQLARAKEETNADFLLIVMSGNFVQRGEPALMDKWTRAQMALSAGADLVLELPPLWSTASAEYFAHASIALLGQLGCVTALCYGCETPDSYLLDKICALLQQEPAAYVQMQNQCLKKGMNYAAARESALQMLLPKTDACSIAQILQSPNNILALEYQRAAHHLAPDIWLHPVLRIGEGYHSNQLSGTYASARSIRSWLCKHPCQSLSPLQTALPSASYRLLETYQAASPFLFPADCSQMLHYCLLENAANGFERFADCTVPFSNKICKNLNSYTDVSQFCTLLKSKDLTYTRISRCLMHILLGICQEDYDAWRSRFYVPYARILGFRRQSKELLSCIKKQSGIPLLGQAKDASRILSAAQMDFFEKHLFADAVYRALCIAKGGRDIPDEYRRQLVRFPSEHTKS